MQCPLRGLCFGRNGIIHNAEYRLSRQQGFSIDELYDSVFEDIFQAFVIPFAFIKEMGNSGTVAGTVSFKVNSFSVISKGKDRYEYSHDMLHGCMWKEPAQI